MSITGLKQMRVARRKTRKLALELFESIEIGTVYLVVPSNTKMIQACTHPAGCLNPAHYEIGIAAIQKDEQHTGDWGFVPLDLLEDIPEKVN